MTTAVKAYKGLGMEGSIARWYDRTTRKDMPEIRQLAARIAALVPAAGSVSGGRAGTGFSLDRACRNAACRCAPWTSARPSSRSPAATPQPKG